MKPLSPRAEAVLLAIVVTQRQERGFRDRPVTPAAEALPDLLGVDKVGYWNAFHVLADRGYITPRGLPRQYGIQHLRRRRLLWTAPGPADAS